MYSMFEDSKSIEVHYASFKWHDEKIDEILGWHLELNQRRSKS